MSDSWYEEIEPGTKLMQGDLIFGCPLVSWKSEALQVSGSGDTEVLHTMTEAILADTVVMTQACDLDQDKVQNVVLCPHITVTEYFDAWRTEMQSKGNNPTNKAWRSHCEVICDGFIWNLALLNAGKTLTLGTEHRIVDFHDIFTVPRTFLEALLRQRGQQRLRLLPPYREHLSQAFARFFVRVGLPTPVSAIWQGR